MCKIIKIEHSIIVLWGVYIFLLILRTPYGILAMEQNVGTLFSIEFDHLMIAVT